MSGAGDVAVASRRRPYPPTVRVDADDIPCDRWNIEPGGGYFGGQIAGRAAARYLLRELRHGPSSLALCDLGHMLCDLLGHVAKAGADDEATMNGRRGQVVGFAHELSIFLRIAVTGEAGRTVDAWDPDDLFTLWECGQFFDEAAYFAELKRRDRANGIDDDEDDDDGRV